MLDRFAKWIELQPHCRATAPAITQAFANNVILRHGCPEIVVSDNGTQFKSTQLEKLLAAYSIKHMYIPAHTPQCNPIECTNRTIKTMITQYVDRNHRNWDERIPEFQFAFNSARYDATDYTSAYLNLGRELLSRQDKKLRQESKEIATAAGLIATKEDKTPHCIFCEQEHESALCGKAKKMSYEDRDRQGERRLLLLHQDGA